MSHSFLAFIDESGDDGVGKFREPGKAGGSSRWLLISACIFRAQHTLEAVRWRDEILQKAGKSGKQNLHFSELSHQQKVVAATVLASFPVRAISIASNKTTISPDTFVHKNQLYFYLTRYLIERISWFCRDMRPKVPEGDGRVKVTFSRRGGLSVDDFRTYLRRLNRDESGEVKIHWPVIDIDAIDAQDHSKSASLQLADVVASAFAAGLEPDLYGNCEWRYAEILKRCTYSHKGKFAGYGLKIRPQPKDLGLTKDQQRLVELFE